MKTLKILVDKRFGDEFEGEYEIRQVSQGEYEDVLIEFMDQATGHLSKANILKVNRKMLWKSLQSQPSGKPLTLDRVLRGDIPYGLAAKLQGAYDEVNGLTPDEQRFLSSPSEGESPTPESPNSGSARNSDGPRES